jgi:hypothetical protein
VRTLLVRDLEARFALPPGDRPLVSVGEHVAAGDSLLEHLRERRIEELDLPGGEGPGEGPHPVPGSRWTPPPGRSGRGGQAERHDGELLAPLPNRRQRWRLVTGETRDLVETPLGGQVADVAPGAEVRVRAAGPAIRGAFAAGSAARGQLQLATDPFGELRPGGIDVGRAGSILVVGSRIDAEALTRARAMGVRGIVVATLPGKELRDFQASERRQRASLHPVAPFGVLVLDGTLRRPIASPVAAILERMAGTEVALLVDPPALVFDTDPGDLEPTHPDWVRIRSGVHAGLEGRVIAALGPRRFSMNVQLEAVRVAIDGAPPVDVPLGDLERLV